MNIAMSNEQIILIVLMGASIGAIAGYIGSLMVTQRMALMGGALGHLTLPGISLALIYGFDVSIGALIFLTGGVIIIWLLEQKTQLPFEALTAVVFATSVATAFLFLPKEETETALLGKITQMPPWTIFTTIILSGLIFLVIRFLYSGIVLASISKDLAHAEGINVKKQNFLYLTCIALVVALGVRIVGGLMTAALLSIPASSSKNISNSLFRYAYTSLILGSISCVLGILISLSTNLPVGPFIIISSAFFFLVSLFLKR